jgi:16S rRNA (guanine1207-N2)-methyltransferase
MPQCCTSAFQIGGGFLTDHYYSRKQQVESNPKSWNFSLRNHDFRFKTDNGVFSKAEVDFGSRLLIETFIPSDEQGLILDVGCGYGPIGLSIGKSFPNTIVHMVDVNERALALSSENAKSNNISNVQIYQSDCLADVKEYGFSDILTNPPIRAGKSIVHQIFEQSFDHLRTGGSLWVVIQKKQGAPSAIDKLTELFGNVEVIDKKKGYFILRSNKG